MYPTRLLAALLFSIAFVAAPAWAGPPLILSPERYRVTTLAAMARERRMEWRRSRLRRFAPASGYTRSSHAERTDRRTHGNDSPGRYICITAKRP